jgi:UPF0755 protein
MLTSLRRCVTFVALIVVIMIVIGVGALNQMYFRSPKADAAPVGVTISEENGTFTEVTQMLKEQGLIKSTFWFKVAGKLSGKANKVQTGTFALKEGMNYSDILSVISSATSPDEVSVTIPEGLNIRQMGEVVESKLGITAADWDAATGVNSPFETHAFVVAAGKPDSVDLEGYLFPDTYRFFKDATAEDVVEKMLDTMEVRYGAAAKNNTNTEAKKLNYTPHQYLTLASIVEKEVRQPTTMATVAGIFMNRLSINMALQVDSSVNYITGGDDPSVSYEDLKIDSPYNTYKYPGLTPGPISAPGVNALTAVFHPTETDYLYFLTDDEGNIFYAKTLQEHNVNKANHLK